ncbi:hypothetical protein BDV96DRAFT_17884 [Lophiotrema nucula]|uniref:Uncharacterized protein n=1 Tax=Lophiotrema nucula TaxID=690887 RepID=A0A6A5ZDD2_9PLEO|nr:hypothetical protein BDV96DRAFT_17884 [Lophiotrema nucula]
MGQNSETLEISMTYFETDERFETEKPYMCLGEPPPGLEKMNCSFSSGRPTKVRDVRGLDTCSFERDGFVVVNHRSEHETSLRSGQADQLASSSLIGYIGEVQSFLKGYFGAEQVTCFDWRFREVHENDCIEDAYADDEEHDLRTRPVLPAYMPHFDLSAGGGWHTLKHI